MSYRAFATQLTDITGVLKDNAGNLLANKSLDFLYKLPTDASFTLAGSALTNVSGSATLTGTLPAPDLVTIDVRFNGDSIYAAYTGEITYNTTVTAPAQTQLNISVSTPVGSGNTWMVNVTGSLTLTTGGGVSGQTITVAMDGSTVGTTNPTDANGGFSFTITNIALGTHAVKASFGGDTAYAASSGNSSFTAGMVVTAGIDPLLIAGIAGAGAVGYVVLRALGKRKKG